MKAYDLVDRRPGVEDKWLATFTAREYAEAAGWVLKGTTTTCTVIERECEPCPYCEEPTEPSGLCSWGRCPTRKQVALDVTGKPMRDPDDQMEYLGG